jgi:hypothetical protein
LVCGRVWFWCCTSEGGDALGIYHRSVNTRCGDYQSRTWHCSCIILCFTLSLPILRSAIWVRLLGFIAVWTQEAGILREGHGIVFTPSYVYTFCTHSSFGYLRAVTASAQAAFSSRNSIQFSSRYSTVHSSHTAFLGSQQYIGEFPFAFKDEHDMAQQYIVGVSYVLEDQHDTSSFHSSLYFRDSFYSYISFRLVDAPGFRLRCNHAACYWTQSIFAAAVRYMIYVSFNIMAWRRYAMVHFGLCIYGATYGATYASAKII